MGDRATTLRLSLGRARVDRVTGDVVGDITARLLVIDEIFMNSRMFLHRIEAGIC